LDIVFVSVECEALSCKSVKRFYMTATDWALLCQWPKARSIKQKLRTAGIIELETSTTYIAISAETFRYFLSCLYCELFESFLATAKLYPLNVQRAQHRKRSRKRKI